MFDIDESNFVLQRIQEEVDSLRSITEGLEHRIKEDEQALKAVGDGFQQRIKEEEASLKALTVGFQQHIEQEIEALKTRTAGLQKNKMALICFSGDLDKLLAAFLLATSAAAMGVEVLMFFSFWACTALRKTKARVKGKDIFGKMFGFMLPKGANKMKLSKMHMGGMGTGMMKYLMKKKKVDSLPEMIQVAEELGIEICVCEMSMNIMGMKRGEIIDYKGIQFAGASKFLKEASGTDLTMFI